MMSISSLMPHYWSQLFVISTQLLDDEELKEMEKMIGRVELMVNGAERTIRVDENGEPQLVIRPKGVLTLYDIEMAFESNADYYAYFERDDGVRITKFDIERELDKIRKWIFLKVKERAYAMRFTRM
jgi:hypothetical protein